MIRVIAGRVDGLEEGETAEFAPEVEARLVRLGVAEPATMAAGSAAESPAEPTEGEQSVRRAEEGSADLEQMTVAQLREEAAALGLDLPDKTRKADIVAVIESASEPPALDAEVAR